MRQFEALNITELCSSALEKRYLVSSQNSFFEANQVMVDLLVCLRNARSKDSAILMFLSSYSCYNFTYNKVNDVIDRVIIPKLTNLPQTSTRQFLYSKQLLTSEQVDCWSNKLVLLFNKHCIIVVFLCAIILDLLFFVEAPNLLVYHSSMSIFTILELLSFVLISSFIHELGHASACKYCKVQHGGIGLGIYFNFPVLYTDVTQIWSLSRKKRCLVNVAGIYFQCILLIILICFYFICVIDVLRYMVLVLNVSFFLTLNPFLKFDGYWLATDILGVPNLHKRSKDLVKYIVLKMRRKTENEKPDLLRIGTKEKVAFFMYVIFVNVFMFYYLCYVIPRLSYTFLSDLPDEVVQLLTFMSNQATPPFALVRNIFSQVMFLALVIYMLSSYGKYIIKKIKLKK